MRHPDTWYEARRLHRLGFAVMWIHPRSKRPVENGWTTGERKSWEYLRDTYSRGFNLGVRTGTPSKFAGGYLACIDVDVKDPKFKGAALASLTKLVGFRALPEVRSGSGNGSRHLYCVTREPFKMLTIEKHPGKWEICVYSDGRQMVLPPSIHPSGKSYTWVHAVADADSLPLMNFERNESSEKEKASRASKSGLQNPGRGLVSGPEWKLDETLDVRWLPGITDETRKLVVSGIWRGEVVTDRSAYLLPAATALASAGLDQASILSVLTDSSTFLGKCAFDHAKTSDRDRAARWLYGYTVKRVLAERDPRIAFDGVPVGGSDLTDEEAADQTAALEAEGDWKSYLEQTDKGKYRNSFNNCQLILANTGSEKVVLGRNEFAVNDFVLCDTAWGAKKDTPITDDLVLRFKKFCVDQFAIEFNVNLVEEVFKCVADRNRFHPVRTWLKGLSWDGVPRIETWLRDFAGAVGPDAYLRAVSKKVLVAMVKRVFVPGCKFDHVLILEGIQGSGKSTLLSNLTEPWFSDETLNIGDKDAVLTMQSKWLIELGELSALSRSEVETMKAFITRRTDRIRAPYGRRVEDYPRQCIFVGSTNLDEYLRDDTGNRRFWPVKCGGRINFEGVRAIRDQLFAEAVGYFELREPLYLDDDATEVLARAEQEKRGEGDEWLGTVRDIVEAEGFPIKGFEMREVTKSMEIHGAHKLTPNDQKRVGKCLRVLGFEKFQEGVGHRRKLWRAVRANLDEPRRTSVQGSTKNEEFFGESSFF